MECWSACQHNNKSSLPASCRCRGAALSTALVTAVYIKCNAAATHLYVRAKHRCVCIACLSPCLRRPPQGTSNVILLPVSIGPHRGLGMPTYIPMCPYAALPYHQSSASQHSPISLLPLTVPACCPFPQRLSACPLARGREPESP